MRVMVIVKATASSEQGKLPDSELMVAMGKYNEELVQAGLMQAGEGLKPSSEAKRVRFSGDSRVITDGPFGNTEELIAGFWIWQVESMEEAVEWVKKCPNPMLEDSNIDIRPIFEIEDFAAADPTGEVRAQEYEMIQQLALQASVVNPYLFFSGRCEEALEFYEQVLDAKILMKIRFSESPDPVPQDMLQTGFENKIMHASFTVGSMTLFASDGCDDKSKFEGFRLSLTLLNQAACKKAFEELSEGGSVDMPLSETFWSPLYGMLTDKFGLGWMLMTNASTEK